MSSPLVTVIIPTYNWSSVLPFSVGTAVRQTFSDIEILVVGDGCTDDSEEVVKSIKDERVRWIGLPTNIGYQSGPNNEGLRQARGELIAYLGHDDLWLPHHLSVLVARIGQGFDFAYGTTAQVGVSSKITDMTPWKLNFEPGMWLPPTGMVHKRSVIERVGAWRNPYELDCDMEVDLWSRAYEAGCKFSFVRRLTAIKFPAAFRKDAYKTKLCHEQEAWSRRIAEEPDLETTELIDLLIPTIIEKSNLLKPIPYKVLVTDFVRETYTRALRRLLSERPKMGRHQSKLEKHQEMIANRRTFKGLD